VNETAESVQTMYRDVVDRFLNQGARVLASRGVLQVRRSDVSALLDVFAPEMQSIFAEVWRQAYDQGTKDMLLSDSLDRPTPFDPEEQPAAQVHTRPRGAWE
jgi:flagellar biosynthesis/type III secretory pathway ATPase